TCVGQERVRKLHSLMEKVSVFRKAVQFIDPAVDPEYTGVYPLAPLYDGYIEYARFLASQGLIEIATKYLERVPASYKYYLPTGEDGLAVLRNRLSCVGEAPWTVTPLGAPPQQQQQPAQQQKQQHQQPVQHQQQQQQSYAQQAYAPYPPQQSMPSVQHYQAPGMPMYPQPTNAGFSGMAQGYPAAQQQQQSVQQQQQQPTMFPPPPQPVNPASVPTGNTPPPRREEAAWNDPPMLNKPAKRAPASAVKPAAIISPFPQGRGTPPPPPAGMAPFSGARSPVGGAAAVPPPPPMSMGASMAKPLPPAPTQQMAFPAAQHAPAQQMMQPGFMPPAMNAPAQMGVGAQPMRGQVVSAASRSGTPAAGAASQQQQQQPAASAAPAKPASKYPEGDRSHLPSEWAGVFSGLNGHLQRAK
ncbi:protein transport protein S31, partial [Coemansia sp. RSA 2703]